MSTLDLTADAHKVRRATSDGTHSRIERFRARFDYLYQALAVLATETATDVWLITTFPGTAVISADPTDDQYNEDFIFYGGQTYTVSGSLADALGAAGYIIGEGFASGFDTGFGV